MRRLADGGLHGQCAIRRADAGVALIFADHRVYRVEHRDVDDGHRPAGSAWTELFVESAILTRCGRRVVEAAGVNCDLIPTTNRVESLPRPMPGTGVEVRSGLVKRAESLALSIGRSAHKDAKSKS